MGKNRKLSCGEPAEWRLEESRPGTETFSCTDHLSAMIADDCVHIKSISDGTACCWLSSEPLEELIDKSMPLVRFMAKEQRATEARAEAAEKQLAELVEEYEEYKGHDLPLLVVTCGLRLELAEARARIAELERDGLVPAGIVPPAMLLDVASRIVRATGADDYADELKRYAIIILGHEERSQER